mmetsp:Transcript_16107/g.48526  ORF Transcript_16107/g.48526 Transcript_16107/m.48526 type:complete len:223 (+) Transcript_16107:272-940(+)
MALDQQQHEICPPKPCCQMERRLPIGSRCVRCRACRQESGRRRCIPQPRSIVQGCQPVGSLCTGLHGTAQQQPGDLDIAALRGHVHGLAPVPELLIWPGTVVQEHADHRQVAPMGCQVQCAAPVRAARGVRIRVALQQSLRGLLHAALRSHMEGRAQRPVLAPPACVRVRPPLQQGADDLPGAVAGGAVQRRRAGLRRGALPSTALQEQHGDLHTVPLHGQL